MSILVTGGTGYIGSHTVVELISRGEEVVIVDNLSNSKICVLDRIEKITGKRPAFYEGDVCDSSLLQRIFDENKIDAVIHFANLKAVGESVEKPVEYYSVNLNTTLSLANVMKKNGCKRIIFSSSATVYGPANRSPYTEDMPVCPTNVYGRTKLVGEEVLVAECEDAIIIRTSWLYSSFGNNFVKTMLRLGRERDMLNVIFDQVGTPTYAADLAQVIFTIIAEREWVAGIYHFSNEGVCSWYDFTIMIHRLAGIECRVMPIESSAYPVRTPRPHYSVLNKSKIKTTFGIEVPYWVESLQRCLNILEQ